MLRSSLRSLLCLLLALPLLLSLNACYSPLVEGAREGVDAAKRPHYDDKAAAGDAEAQFKLGMTYCCEFGPQFERDVTVYDNQKATHWICASAHQGYGPAQLQLGKIYFGKGIRGFGVIRRLSYWLGDHRTVPEIAWVYASVAENNGEKDATKLRSKIEKKLKPEQLSQGQADLAHWQDLPCEWHDVIPPKDAKAGDPA